jgi:hypothetical protein
MTDKNEIYRGLLTELNAFIAKAYKTNKDLEVMVSNEMTPTGTGKVSIYLPDASVIDTFTVDLNDLEKTKATILASIGV